MGQLMSHFYFIPDDKSFSYALPLEFSWLPNLHLNEDSVCGDHFFRAPVVAAYTYGAYSAIVPDLQFVMSQRQVPHALDLRVFGTGAEAPRLSYGLSTWQIEDHVFTRHDPDVTAEVDEDELVYGFDLFVGQASGPELVVREITEFLWQRDAQKYMQDVRPQVLPFQEYARRYSYVHELGRWATKAIVNGRSCYGIRELDNFKRGALFSAWWNDLVIGYGIKHYARKWSDEKLHDIADGMERLSLSAPQNKGAFPCVYNWNSQQFEGSLFWTSRAGDFLDGYDAQAMGVSAWWRLYWHDHLSHTPGLLNSVISYCEFLTEKQLPSGAIPTYYFSDLRAANPLKESAVTALSGAVLAKTALLTGAQELEAAAVAAGKFVDQQIVPKLLFQDFEVFYSCSRKSYHYFDQWAGLPPHNNLAIQWTADQFLALYRLTGKQYWLDRGQYVLALLSLYQQVWDPPFYEAYLFGGFGVMNTDGEWNDGRQSRFVPTYADYYVATGNLEYLERAVAACRAAFALMDIKENHANRINHVTMEMGPGLGFAPENCLHHGPGPIRGPRGYTGYNWASGGALAASAYLEEMFGGVLVDGAARKVVGIDGAKASVVNWTEKSVSLNITSAIKELPFPYTGDHSIVVKFNRMPGQMYTVTINGNVFRDVKSDQLKRGLEVQI